MPDMKMSELERRTLVAPEVPGNGKYPYGLKISLTDKELEKLDLGEDPQVDDVFEMTIKVKIVEVSKDENEGRRVELQITEMDMVEKKEKDQGASKILYGN